MIRCATSTPNCVTKCASNCLRLLKASGSTVLYVTQDYKEAMALGDRIAVLSDRDFAQIARARRDLSTARNDQCR